MSIQSITIRQQGLTLVEILVAMVIGAFLIGGVLSTFLNAKRTYQMQENMSRLQENGRFAMEFISRDLRIADFQGCSSTAANNIIKISNPNTNPVPITLTGGNNLAITGSNNVTDSCNSIACGGSDECIVASDSISYHYGQNCGNLTGNMATDDANVQISASNSCNIQQYDILLISDCVSADIFVATSASSAAGTQTIAHATNQNTTNKLSRVYGTDAQLFKLNSSTYFLRTGAGGQPALWRMDNIKPSGGTNPVELIEGIEDMQILYGSDTDADGAPNYYVDAGTVPNMGQVVSVKLTLTALTLDSNLTSTGDGRLRRTFSSTIRLRNR